MLFFLLAIYISQLDAGNSLAVPAPSSGLRSMRDISAQNLVSEGACICAADQRSVWDILWSCLATIFACSWVAVHPNISKPGASQLSGALKRLELMAWTVIAPEIMIMWAMRQWIGARELAKDYKDENWTVTHGHFLQMGGFMLYERGEAIGVLSPHNLRSLYDRGRIKFPSVTEEEIEDRSKGDALSKALAIGQSAWFACQCISRVAQGLITTELELITLAFALLNGFMYFFWWNKPLDVKAGIPVYVLPEADRYSEIERWYEEADEDEVGEDVGEEEQGAQAGEHPSSDVPQAQPEGQAKSETFFRSRIVHPISRLLIPVFALFSRLGVIFQGKVLLAAISRLFSPVFALLSRLGDMSDAIERSRSHTIKNYSMEVPTFYALRKEPKEISRIMVVISFIGMLFGAIHTAGWNFSFPSPAEALLWRMSSVIILAVPFIMAVERGLCVIYEKTKGLLEYISDKAVDIIGMFVAYICLPLYIVARITLLVEAFLALRNLVPQALAQVQWTLFLPHI